jgi:hypothetical protein
MEVWTYAWIRYGWPKTPPGVANSPHGFPAGPVDDYFMPIKCPTPLGVALLCPTFHQL